MKSYIIFISIISVLLLSIPLYASLEISVTTDKPVYQVGEIIKVYVSLYNPTPLPVKLTYGSSLTATYLMDQSYYWHTDVVYNPYISSLTIQPEQTFTWQLNHHQTYYPLNIGYHSVQGGSMAGEMWGQLSEPVEFRVIPEPASIFLLGTGLVLSRRIQLRWKRTKS